MEPIKPIQGFTLKLTTWEYQGETETNYNVSAECGDRIASFQGIELYNEHGIARMQEHREKCIACKIVRGESKASVLNQEQIANLFSVGIDGKRSATRNYESGRGFLAHYGTIEGVRTEQGKLIGNTQCWSAGFARCTFWGDIRLPLSALQDNAETTDLRGIEIIETKEDTETGAEITLFSMTSYNRQHERSVAFWLFGTDEGRPFLVRLAEPVATIKDALDILKPSEARGRNDVQRQGDLFFIPTDKDLTNLNTDKAHFVTYDKPDWQTENTVKAKKLYKPEIMISGDHVRHNAQELKLDGVFATYARGWITHPEHKKIKLDTWCLVVKNRALQSIDCSRRGTGGGD